MKTKRKHYTDKHFDAISHDSSVAFARVKLTKKELAAKVIEDAEFNVDNLKVLSILAFISGVLGLIGSWLV